MTTSDRVLGVLGLFTTDHPEWTVEGAAKELGLAVSTAYRYFRSLAKAGLIVAFAAGRYVLGPAIIQLDRQMRLMDPLTTTAQPIMKRLTGQLPTRTIVLLCRLFRNQVMCVHQESAERPDFAISYERGRPMPLFRGAASKSILANLPSRTVKAFHAEHGADMAQASLGTNWEEVKQRLRELRTAGVSITQGELDPGMTGIAVPLFEPDGIVVGSLSIVMRVQDRTPRVVTAVTKLLQAGSEEIRWALSVLAAGHDTAASPARPPKGGSRKRQPARARSKRAQSRAAADTRKKVRAAGSARTRR